MLLLICGLAGLLVSAKRLMLDQEEQAAGGDSAAQASATSEGDGADSKSQARDNKSAAQTSKLLAALRAGSTEQTQLALEVLLPDLMRRDILTAAELAQQLESWASRERVLLDVADQWAESDPEAAFRWAGKLPESEQQNVMTMICQKLAMHEPAKAMALAETHPGQGKAVLTKSLAGLWLRDDPGPASEWILRQESPSFRESCWSSAVGVLAQRAPEQAANLALDHIATDELLESAVIDVLHQWILQDRTAAAEWVDSFPAGGLRTRAEGELKGRH